MVKAQIKTRGVICCQLKFVREGVLRRTVVKAVDAVLQDKHGMSAIGFGHVVAASDAIWMQNNIVSNFISNSMAVYCVNVSFYVKKIHSFK